MCVYFLKKLKKKKNRGSYPQIKNGYIKLRTTLKKLL